MLTAHFAGENVEAVAVFDDRAAVNQHGFHSGRVALHFLGVDHVGELLLFGRSKDRGGERGIGR